MHTHGLSRAVAALDDVLGQLYGGAAVLLSDKHTLREQTGVPPASRRRALRDALTPAGFGASAFDNATRERIDTFATDLRVAYEKYLSDSKRSQVDGKGPAEHIEKNLHDWPRIDRVANQAKVWTDETFGHYATGPVFEHERNIHDWFDVFGRRHGGKDPDQRRRIAKKELRSALFDSEHLPTFLREHGAFPEFSEGGKAINVEAGIVNELIDELVKREGIVDLVLQIARGRPGRANPATRDVYIQRFLEPEGWRNQVFLWGLAQTLVHEYLHTLQHPEWNRYLRSLGRGQAENTLAEGAIDVLTGIVWAGVKGRVRHPDVKAIIEDAFSDLPPLSERDMPNPSKVRYESYAEVMKLIEVIGGIENLYAAIFLGDIEKITSPITLLLVRSPDNPLPNANSLLSSSASTPCRPSDARSSASVSSSPAHRPAN